MTIVYHITSRLAWDAAQQVGEYRAESLDTQGFIHFSKREQVIGTANRYYRNTPGLVLLKIDAERLKAELRYEPPAEAPDSDARFPHLYGALNLNAVIAALDFPHDAGGGWAALPVTAD
jgi:uncharacterized protein (DUF952 family)